MRVCIYHYYNLHQTFTKKKKMTHLLQRTRVIIIIAPIRADITETIPIENAHPSSPAASKIKKK